MKLLAVDDDPLVLDILRSVLEPADGYELEVSSDPEGSLARLLAGETYDALLLDIEMPRLNGIDLCRSLRRSPEGRDLPIVMLTALDSKGAIDRAFAAGASDYVNKPIIPRELMARLSNIVRLSQLGRATQPAAETPGPALAVPIHEPFAIPDVDFVIGPEALESYVSKLSKQDLFGSAVFGFSVIGIEKLHQTLSGFDFRALMTDIAEAISDCLNPNQFLMSYVGNGTFLCVTERGWVPQPKEFACYVERLIRIMELHDSLGQPISVNLACSPILRLTWKSGNRAIDTLALVHEQAEAAAAKMWQERTDPALWYASLMRTA